MIDNRKQVALGDTVLMKKPHACKTNDWEVMRVGADIKLKCMGCNHLIMMSRAEFNKKLKKVLTRANDPANKKLEYYVPVDQIARPNFE